MSYLPARNRWAGKGAIVLLLYLFSFHSYGQLDKAYPSRAGRIGVTVYIDGKELKLGSSELMTILDFETMQVTLKLDPNTLQSHVPEIDKKLHEEIMREVVFRGKIAMAFINPRRNAVDDFMIPGTLSLNGFELPVEMQGSLQYMDQAPAMKSMLYIHYDLPLADFGLDKTLADFGDFGCIEVVQTIISQ